MRSSFKLSFLPFFPYLIIWSEIAFEGNDFAFWPFSLHAEAPLDQAQAFKGHDYDFFCHAPTALSVFKLNPTSLEANT